MTASIDLVGSPQAGNPFPGQADTAETTAASVYWTSGTVTVTVVSGATVNYWTTDPDGNAAAGTIALNGSQNFTAPGWIATQGSSSTVTISGPGY